jgi:1-acyl-sn-glycerol-3-phosphate acyltransferase
MTSVFAMSAGHLSEGFNRRSRPLAADTGALPPRPSAIYLLVGALSWPVVRFGFRLRARGVENLPDGGYVLAANHISNFDPWAIGLPLFPRRYLRFMGKSELFWPPLKQFITAGGAFPVHRGQGDVAAIETAIELVRQGHLVVMFPEGTRRRKGLRKKYQPKAHTGAARIALGARCPLVPTAIAGTDRLTRLGPLRIAYGSPVDLSDLEGHDPRDAAQEATDRLMAEIERLKATL